jgi:hypothetical protein
MRNHDSDLTKAEKRENKHTKKKNGMRVSNKSIFVIEEVKVKKGKEAK